VVRKTLPRSIFGPSHPDYPVLKSIGDEIDARAGGRAALCDRLPVLLRDCIDDVLKTPKTGRISYAQLEKTEKTHIGTCVEIELRDFLGVPKGKLDTVIAGYDTDIKHTMGSNWMIPKEAQNHPCILVAADEASGLCYLGLIVAKLEYLTASENRDAKKSVSASGFENIFWLIQGESYPANFWQTIPPGAVTRIFSGTSGNERVINLFREVQERPISREVVNATAKQKDFTRRIRSDAGRGTRDQLADEGIVLISGAYGSELIELFGLPACGKSEFISYRPKTNQECAAARTFGFKV
jgi:hypothetical protein